MNYTQDNSSHQNSSNENAEIFGFFEEKADHHFRTEIPNIIFDMELDVSTLAVYCYIKRTAGDSGKCWKSRKCIYQALKISERQLDKCIENLEMGKNKFNLKLIKKTKRFKKDGSPDTSLLSVINIWPENGKYYKGGGGARNAPGVGHHMREGGAPGTYKEKQHEEEPYISKKTTTTRESSNQKNSVVVVFSDLNKLKLSQELKEKLSKQYPEAKISKAVERTLRWTERESDAKAIQHILKNFDSWEDSLTKEEIIKENIKELAKLKHLDGKKFGVTNVVIGVNYVEFVAGMQCKQISVDEKNFKDKINEEILRIKEK